MRSVLFLLLTFAVYSSASIFSRLASMQPPLSAGYICYLGGVLLVLGIYALMWQKVLEKWPLKRAYPFKSITLPMILLISWGLFGETITVCNMIGSALIVSGIVVISLNDDKA